MRLQDQRAAGLLARPVDADDDRRVGMLCRTTARRRDGAAIALAVHREPVHREAALAQRAEHEILHRVLGAPHGGKADHLPGERQ